MNAMAQHNSRVRLASALGVLAAVFLAHTLPRLAAVYLLILLALAATACLRRHAQLVLLLLSPLLAGLLLIWAVVLPASQLPPDQPNGASYALFSWLRIVACSGLLQALLLPLTDQPMQLRRFLERCGLRGAPAVLIMASIVFIPEMRRRMSQVVDARRAQGHAVQGWAGLRQLPQLLMPLIASLLDTATRRAELWSHRGILLRPAGVGGQADLHWHSLAALLLAATALALGLWP